MLESIYNIGGGKQQSPLARYLSSVNGASRAIPGGPSAAGFGGLPPDERPSVDQSGNYTPPATPTTPGLQPAGAGTNPLGPSLPSISTDYSSDPVLQAMLSGSAVDETDADAQALAADRSVLGQYGDRSLAASVLGEGDPTLGSISDNPDTSTSTLARLKRGYGQTVHASEDAMNENNLFYGGARIKRLGDLAKDEQTQEADANTAVHQALDQIGATLASTKQGIRTSRANAESDAAGRAAQAAILQALLGGDAGGGGGGGVGGLTPGVAPNVSASDAAASGAPIDDVNSIVGPAHTLVDPGFLTNDNPPVDLGNGFVYDPATHTVRKTGTPSAV